MTKEELAALLNGREYGEEITKEEAAAAKAAGLLVVYGASDDLMEFDGAFRDEQGAWGGTTARLTPTGLLPYWDNARDDEETAEQYFKDKAIAKSIDAIWAKGDYSWQFKTDIPHATFEIVDGEDKYCRGLVIALADLSA